MKLVRVLNHTGSAIDTVLIDVETGRKIENVTKFSIEQEAGSPPMIHYTVLAETQLGVVCVRSEDQG